MSSVCTSQSLKSARRKSPSASLWRRKSELSMGWERVKGIEPSCPAWEAGVLPLNYTRVPISDFGLWIAECGFASPEHYCQEITSSEPVKLPFLPRTPSFPSDQEITPC